MVACFTDQDRGTLSSVQPFLVGCLRYADEFIGQAGFFVSLDSKHMLPTEKVIDTPACYFSENVTNADKSNPLPLTMDL